MEYKINTIGVLTSGGDAPGMNAAVRAVTRAAIANNIRVKAIFRGYKGLMDGEVQEFSTQDVSGIIQRGGTILKSARSEEYKNSGIVLVQEHAIPGGAQAVAKAIEQAHPEYGTRVTILGHLQRGGSPSAFDRILASRLGCAAVQALMEEQRSIMVGLQNGDVVYVPLSKAIKEKKDIKDDKWQALQVLSL